MNSFHVSSLLKDLFIFGAKNSNSCIVTFLGGKNYKLCQFWKVSFLARKFKYYSIKVSQFFGAKIQTELTFESCHFSVKIQIPVIFAIYGGKIQTFLHDWKTLRWFSGLDCTPAIPGQLGLFSAFSKKGGAVVPFLCLCVSLLSELLLLQPGLHFRGKP